MRDEGRPGRILAADIGGTKTLLGVFARTGGRPRAIAVRAFDTTAFARVASVVDAFARVAGTPLDVDAAVVGVAGPVVGNRAELTNGTWGVDTDELAACTGTSRVGVINDLAALGQAVAVLTPEELCVLQDGTPAADGNAAVIAAGTGLGETTLHRVGGVWRPLAAEAGHADFAARTPREVDLLISLTRDRGRASVEDVLSGPGLLTLHRFTHAGRACPGADASGRVPLTPAGVTQSASSGTCTACAEALAMFVAALGAEAGNLALRAMATAGVYLGGGIAPQILPALQTGDFLTAFRAKGPMSALLAQVPVSVILNAEAGLLGAAVYAEGLADPTPRS